VKDGESGDNYYLIEIEQAGTFRVVDVPEEELRRVLSTVAPSALFPYARETIDSLVTKANFPPLRLAPINFESLYQRAVEQQKQAETNSPDNADTVQ
jgi:preprotein translocase subunit SecB